MAVKIITKTKPTVSDVLAAYKKKLGDTIGSYGGLPVNSERVPTGLFPFDLATGGGFPRGRCSIVYGPEDSCKTSLALKAIAHHQRLWPELTNAYVAIEPFDQIWAKKLGVDTDKLVVINPAYAEQVVDITTEILDAEDCGVVVVDSLAAMITTQEADKSAESANPGAQGLVTGKLVRKAVLSLNEANKQGRMPTLIYINQTRYKIGVSYGDPETMPGGKAPLYQAQLRVRTYSKAVKDDKVSDLYPVRRDVSFIIKKAKVPLIADHGKFEMVTYPHNGLVVGETDDFSTVVEYLKGYSVFEKLKNGYKIVDDTYPTQQAFKDRLYGDRAFGAKIRHAIIERALEDYEKLIQPAAAGEINADGELVEDVSA